MTPQQAKRIIEGLLFISDKPVALKRIKDVVGELEYLELRQAVEELKQEYVQQQHAFRLQEVAGGYQLATDAELATWIKRALSMPRQTPLSKAALETLAIVAYKQPLTKAEIEAIRGVDGSAGIETLMEHQFVKVAGRKDTPGRPLLYGTTPEFLRHFGLNTLDDLPKRMDPSGNVPGFDPSPATDTPPHGPTDAAPADRPAGSETVEAAQR